jgi:heme/copper-type cytochrome/quinol oxidase subunit 2
MRIITAVLSIILVVFVTLMIVQMIYNLYNALEPIGLRPTALDWFQVNYLNIFGPWIPFIIILLIGAAIVYTWYKEV